MTYTPSNIYYRAFETHVHGVLEKLDKRLPGLEDAQRNVEVVMARHGLYDAAFQQIVLLCSSIAPVCIIGVVSVYMEYNCVYYYDTCNIRRGFPADRTAVLEHRTGMYAVCCIKQCLCIKPPLYTTIPLYHTCVLNPLYIV
jgi:hypothetical protein